MPCYHPIEAYQCPDGSVVFSERRRFDSIRTLQLPCGQCVGCRLERSRQWAMRCVHEASLYRHNSYVTLTYDDASVKPSLCYRDFQLFMKRLRKAAVGDGPVRFYMCGEYGEDFGRPHFHAILFNCHFPDRRYWKKSGEFRLYRSEALERLWPFGHSSVGDVSFESAAYVARYVMKKVTGDAAASHYRRIDVSTGELVDVVPEFNHMSLRPGIGFNWLSKFYSDVYPEGMTVVNGVKVRPPKYYDRIFSKVDSDAFAVVSMERERYAHDRSSDSTDERLAVREVVTKARISSLTRKL